MNFSSKVAVHTTILFLYANLINLVFLIAHVTVVAVLRPIVIYEYFLIPVLITLRFPAVVTWLFWFLILTLDLLNSVSAIFLFKLPEFFKNLEFSLLYEFSVTQYFLVFLFLCFLYGNFLLIRRLSGMAIERKKFVIGFFLVFILFIFLLDYLNGTARLADHRRKILITRYNIGGSTIRISGITFTDLFSDPLEPVRIKKSVTYQTFANDSTGNQLLILVESWGLPAQEQNWEKIKNTISEKASPTGWNVEFGATEFEGSTTSAELRELLSRSGNYRYFLDKDDTKGIESIFTIKKEQGYSTMAAHSFSGRMFLRASWWKNIGIDSTYFLEEIVKRRRLTTRSLNYATPFISVNDEDVYTFISSLPSFNDQKRFVYFLTENSHLPFHEPESTNVASRALLPADRPVVSFENDLSTEGNSQLRRIQELIFFFIQSQESKQWSKILIMGDHMAPFVIARDREFYSSTQVPYLILSTQ